MGDLTGGWRFLPPLAIGLLVLGVGATLAVAGSTLGYDFLAYHAAGSRVLGGQPAYDTSFQAAGGFGLFYYPPTFIPLVLAFGALPAAVAPALSMNRRAHGPVRWASIAIAKRSFG